MNNLNALLSSLAETPFFHGSLIIFGLLLCFFGWVAFRLLIATGTASLLGLALYVYSQDSWALSSWLAATLSVLVGIAISGSVLSLKASGTALFCAACGALSVRLGLELSGLEPATWVALLLSFLGAIFGVLLTKLTVTFGTAFIGTVFVAYGFGYLFKIEILLSVLRMNSQTSDHGYVVDTVLLALVLFSGLAQLRSTRNIDTRMASFAAKEATYG